MFFGDTREFSYSLKALDGLKIRSSNCFFTISTRKFSRTVVVWHGTVPKSYGSSVRATVFSLLENIFIKIAGARLPRGDQNPIHLELQDPDPVLKCHTNWHFNRDCAWGDDECAE